MEGRIKNLGIALTVVWFVLIKTAEAGPPFVTDDPEVPPVGGWEINVPFTLNRTPGSNQMNAPLLDFNYGLPQLQLEFDIPIAVSSDRKSTNAGLGDLLYGVKWRFFDDEKTQIQFGTYPQMFAPTGNYRRGLGGGRPNYILPLQTEKSWDKWTLYGDVGYRLQTALGQQSYWYTGAVLQRDINDRLSLGVELFGNTTTVPNGRPDFAFNVGGSLKLNDHLNFIFTGGRDFVGDTHAMLYLGLQIVTKVEK
ncbi:MAG TPA: transporter [Chthoniobacterales bacterium]